MLASELAMEYEIYDKEITKPLQAEQQRHCNR